MTDKKEYIQEWEAYLDNFKPMIAGLLEQMSDPGNSQLRLELYRHMFSEIAAGYIGLMHADPAHPDWWPILTQAFNNIGVPNPDGVYYGTPVDSDGVYRISGYRGTVRVVNFQVGGESMLARGEGSWGLTLANYDLDEGISLGPDGEFEFVISSKRPEGYQGDWREMPKDATYMLVRQFSYDWEREVDARIAIERLDTPAAKPRPSPEDIHRGLQQIAIWVESHMKNTLQGPIDIKNGLGTNSIVVQDLSHTAGLKGQLYSQTFFDLQPDEALIVEIEMPKKCRYWNFQLANEMWSTLDFMHRQTSINGFTAVKDPDGKVRIVISEQDPGTANWLDTLGYQRGIALSRWDRCDNAPEIEISKSAVSEVFNLLPDDVRKVSLEQREESIRIRRKAAQLRRRW